jgi:hypothetical protein
MKKIKSFSSVKDSVNRVKRQATDWKRIFTKNTSDKELLSNMYKELLKLNNKKTISTKNEPKQYHNHNKLFPLRSGVKHFHNSYVT